MTGRLRLAIVNGYMRGFQENGIPFGVPIRSVSIAHQGLLGYTYFKGKLSYGDMRGLSLQDLF